MCRMLNSSGLIIVSTPTSNEAAAAVVAIFTTDFFIILYRDMGCNVRRDLRGIANMGGVLQHVQQKKQLKLKFYFSYSVH